MNASVSKKKDLSSNWIHKIQQIKFRHIDD